MQESSWQIQPFEAATDTALAFTLWQTTLGQEWPIDFQRFQQILSSSESRHFVARAQGQVIGFVATAQTLHKGEKIGHVQVLLVAPTWQRRSLGSALLDKALDQLRAARVDFAQLGGRTPRFWCGVPDNLPGARAFFQARGWQFTETVYDLSQDLSQYTTPPVIDQRMVTEQITLDTASEADIPEVLAFEAREFLGWLAHYERLAGLGDYQDILVARDQRTGQVVGTLLMSTPQSNTTRTDVVWRVLLGSDAGSMGAVGVAEAEHGRGIGIALVARASDLLRARGIRNCYIDWVVITDFYAKLGYKKWRALQMSERTL
ncbi:MAG TPA: GNAT family N-acetyltransferase [Ktedonobacteraceae bacterium]